MKYFYLEFSNKRINLTEEQVLKLQKQLQDSNIRFIKINDELIGVSFIKGIFRDYEKEDMEERTNRLKQQIGQKDELGLKNLNELKNRFGLGQNKTDNT